MRRGRLWLLLRAGVIIALFSLFCVYHDAEAKNFIDRATFFSSGRLESMISSIEHMSTSIVLFILIAALSSCAPRSDQTLILKLMRTIEECVEKKDVSGVMAHLAEDYEDFEGRDRKETRTLIEDYFKRRYGIVVHLLHTRFGGVREEGEAFLETDVVLSSGGAEALRKWLRFAGDFYRFKLELRKTPEGWKIRRAEWESLSVDKLFPESAPILKKWFPDF